MHHVTQYGPTDCYWEISNWRETCTNICPRTLSAPKSEQKLEENLSPLFFLQILVLFQILFQTEICDFLNKNKRFQTQ